MTGLHSAFTESILNLIVDHNSKYQHEQRHNSSCSLDIWVYISGESLWGVKQAFILHFPSTLSQQ